MLYSFQDNLIEIPYTKLQQEEPMFDVSEKATEMIKEAFKSQEKIPSIRVAYDKGG
jgi:hypothetical protein